MWAGQKDRLEVNAVGGTDNGTLLWVGQNERQKYIVVGRTERKTREHCCEGIK